MFTTGFFAMVSGLLVVLFGATARIPGGGNARAQSASELKAVAVSGHLAVVRPGAATLPQMVVSQAGRRRTAHSGFAPFLAAATAHRSARFDSRVAITAREIAFAGRSLLSYYPTGPPRIS